MKKGKQFKRTALPLSAKSMVSLMLLLIAMLLPQGAWATNFISEIKISVENGNSGNNAKSRLRNDGYTLVEADLNGGAGSKTDYVYIGYKTSTNAADAITGLLIVESSSDPKFDAHAFDNITNANVIYNGKNYYRCDNYKVNDDGRLDCDLNRHNSKGADIVLYYTKDGNTADGGTPLTSITVVGNTTTTGVTYTRHWQYGTAQNGTGNTDVYGNTNQGNGTAHYITYTTHTHNYSATFSWAKDGKSCTATVSCSCGDTHSNLACTVTDEVKKAATCFGQGTTTYTAKITSNGKDFSATTDKTVNFLGHDMTEHAATSPTCTKDGNYRYYTCSRACCSGKYYKNGSSQTSVTYANQAETVDPMYNHNMTEHAATGATCTKEGLCRYYTCSRAWCSGKYYKDNGAHTTNEYANQAAMVTAALGHDNYTPTYTWGGDYKAATCTLTLQCGRCNAIVYDDKITTSKVSANHENATCSKFGNERWTATGSYSKAGDASYKGTAQTKDYNIPKIPHTFAANDAAQGVCTVCDHGFFRYTSRTKDEVVEPDIPENLKDAKGNSLTIISNTNENGKGVIEFNKPLVTIGNGAFFRRDGFSGDLILPNSVTSIGESAFFECKGFTGNLIFGNSVTNIGKSAFNGCGFTGDLVLPNSLTSIENGAFEDCSGFNGNLILPNSVTNIGYCSFMGCSGFTGNLILPNKVESIESFAFHNCFNFSGVIMKSIPEIDLNAFSNITSNKSVVLSDDSYVYKDRNRYFPTVVSATAPCTLDLAGVDYITNLTINHGNLIEEKDAAHLVLSSICGGDTYHYSCDKCHGVMADTYIAGTGTGNHTFAADDAAQSVCTVCNHGFFRYTSKDNAVIEPVTPENLKDAKGNSLTIISNTNVDGNGVIEFNNPLVTIGESAFVGCSGLTGSLTIGNSVTSIGESAFSGCSGLTGSLTIGNSVKSIGNNAFAGCSGFTGNLTIGNSVTSIGNNAFAGCSGFTGNLILPNSLTSIGETAFVSCSGFTGNLTIGNSVTSIGKSAFVGCSGFTGNLTIGNSVKSIGETAFADCSGFTGNLTIGNSVTNIGNGVFAVCSGFTGNLILPNSLKSIGDEAFYGCSGFTGLEMRSVPQVGNGAFDVVTNNKTVVLSDNSYVYKGENPDFPTVLSVTSPCHLDLTDSAVENYDVQNTHLWSEYVFNNDAKCNEDGHMIRHCTRQGCTVTEQIVATGTAGHQYKMVELLSGPASGAWTLSDSNIACSESSIQFSSSYATASQTVAVDYKLNQSIIVSCDYQIVDAGNRQSGYARVEVELLDKNKYVWWSKYLLDWCDRNYQMNSKEPVRMTIPLNKNICYVRMTVKGRDQKLAAGNSGPIFSNMSIQTAAILDIKKPTCTEKGTKGYICQLCGHEESKEEVDALGHNFVEGFCSVCDETVDFNTLLQLILRGTWSEKQLQTYDINTDSKLSISDLTKFVDKLKKHKSGSSTEELEEDDFVW